MRLSVPNVKGIDVKHRTGFIGQLMRPATEIEGEWTRFALPSVAGHVLASVSGELTYVFPKAPKPDQLPANGAVLIGAIPDAAGDFIDLKTAKWLAHPAIAGPDTGTARTIESWSNGFRYVGEGEAGDGRIGLRRPQLGALHAIHAHWSTSKDVATVVMPTGTGKTETMLATLVSARCSRVLVLVPTDALRTQISQKFFSLGILKDPHASLLQPDVLRPVVGMLAKTPTTPEEVDEFFMQCNVVVTTSALAGRCSEAVQERMAERCSHLFIDEAHHAEAATWKQFKSHFKGQRPILQFTATPFREDGQPLDGKIIYVYPMRQAQSEGYFKPIRFSSVYAFNSARADRDIAEKVLEELRADTTGLHVAMARVSTQRRATEVRAIYVGLGQFNPIVIHSGLKQTEIDEARRKLESGESRIVICVDMLGEGFDMAGRRGIDDPGLRWLESQPPPFILAIDEPPAVRFKRSIPNNANPRLPQAALSLRDVIHRRLTEPVRYCYPLRTASDRATAEAVIAVAEQVHTLGTGEDMCTVRGRVAEHAPESLNDIRLWLPGSAAPARIQTAYVAWLRVPVAGSLVSLEERFQAFQHRLDGGEAGYARAVLPPARHDLCAYRPSDEVPRSAFLPLKLVAPDGIEPLKVHVGTVVRALSKKFEGAAQIWPSRGAIGGEPPTTLKRSQAAEIARLREGAIGGEPPTTLKPRPQDLCGARGLGAIGGEPPTTLKLGGAVVVNITFLAQSAASRRLR